MISINELLQKSNLNNYRPTRKAYTAQEWTMDGMLDAVREIGKSLNPRFVLDSDNRDVYENVIYWLMGDPLFRAFNPVTGDVIPGRLDRGIYIAGNTGSGKTLLMKILSRLYWLNRFVYYTGNPVEWEEFRADYICERYAVSGDVSHYRNSPLLCIQDFGSETKEIQYMGNKVNVLKSIIEARGDRTDVVTMITSNIPLEHDYIRNTYGDRVKSRLAEMCNYLVLRGADRRFNFQ